MTPRLWITRTQSGATQSAQAWRRAGFEPVVAPLLRVDPVEADPDALADRALIFTSAHGVRHCGLRGDGRTVYAVGRATATAAHNAGFETVKASDGDWADLLDIIDPADAPFVHVSGRIVQGQLVEGLRRRGVAVGRQIVYETTPVVDWPVDPACIDAVALYSPLAAKTLMALPARDLSHWTAYCFSANVAAPLRGMNVAVAAAPNEAALIACSAGAAG